MYLHSAKNDAVPQITPIAKAAIRVGAPLYNRGHVAECAQLYENTCRLLAARIAKSDASLCCTMIGWM